MPKISVIVPVYNIEEYLCQCIESIISQTLSDIEIILIDDGSTDKSGMICDDYSVRDERVRVIHKKNEGLSCARNDGIKASTAKYIMFVDGDDWVDPDFCYVPFEVAIKNNADLVLFSHKRINKDGCGFPVKTKMASGFLNAEQAIYYSVSVTNAVWVGLYRKDLFDSVKFPEGKLYEDVAVFHRLIHNAKKVYLLNKYLYYRRVGRAGSITTALETRNHPDMREMFVNKINDLISWGYEDFAKQCALSMIINYGWKENGQEWFARICKELQWSDDRNNYISKKHKLLGTVFQASPTLFDAICKITVPAHLNCHKSKL